MAIGFRKLVKTFLDVPRWVGTESIKDQWKSLKTLMNSFKEKPETSESFKDAVKRLKLTNGQIDQIQRKYHRNFLIYFSLLWIVLAYAIFLGWSAHYRALIACISALFVLASFAFREHFWYTQIKSKTLGMTFQSWLKAVSEGE
jgi:intracellular multiplication protein IcmV